jgi:hypothetical protein
MLVKDEADIIGTTVPHLLASVDEVIVADNLSTDGTREILDGIRDSRLTVIEDPEVGYFQSWKMTGLAGMAAERGHEWVLPCDADEIWHSCETDTRIADTLASIDAKNVGVVTAELFDHVTTGAVPEGELALPVGQIPWRRREAAPLPKVAARLLPGLVIEQGNHGAHFPGRPAVKGGLLAVRHFPYRSVRQFVRKVRNGAAAYAATDLPWSMGQHWREYGQHLERGGEAAIREIYETWFHVADPASDPLLIFDPAPTLPLDATEVEYRERIAR